MAEEADEHTHASDDIGTRMNKLQDTIRTTDYDSLQKQVYICFANGCILLTSFLQLQGTPGWSAELRDESGQSVLSETEQKGIEFAFQKAKWIIPFFTNQVNEGGAIGIPNFAPGGSLINTGTKLTGEDVSLDRMFQAFMKKTQELDEFWANFGKKDPGLSKLFTEGDLIIPTPNPLITIPIPKKPLVQLLVTVLDTFRLSAGLAGDNSLLLTLIIFMEELITGQWRQMLMTAAAFISPSGMAIGILFKYLINAWQLISPDLRTKITKDMYIGSKSLFIGFLLWCATSLPPAFLRNRVDEALGKLRGMVEGLESKVDSLTQAAQQELSSKGLQLKFPGLQLDILKEISLDDIQNLQTLARWPVIVCTEEFQDILNPLKADPIFRLILELSNIPILDEDRYEVCKTEKLKTLGESLATAAEPSVEPLAQEGGKGKRNIKRKVTRRNNKQKVIKRQSRRNYT
jgi:hypothetical protein